MERVVAYVHWQTMSSGATSLWPFSMSCSAYRVHIILVPIVHCQEPRLDLRDACVVQVFGLDRPVSGIAESLANPTSYACGRCRHTCAPGSGTPASSPCQRSAIAGAVVSWIKTILFAVRTGRGREIYDSFESSKQLSRKSFHSYSEPTSNLRHAVVHVLSRPARGSSVCP